jgi:hypothetical protein
MLQTPKDQQPDGLFSQGAFGFFFAVEGVCQTIGAPVTVYIVAVGNA